MEMFEKLPAHVFYALQKANIDSSVIRNFAEGRQNFANSVNKIKEDNINDHKTNIGIRAMFEMMSIGWLKEEDVNSKEVACCVAGFEECMLDAIILPCESDDDNKTWNNGLEELTDKEFGILLFSICLEFLEESREQIDIMCGEGAYEFIKKALKRYRLKKPAHNVEK